MQCFALCNKLQQQTVPSWATLKLVRFGWVISRKRGIFVFIRRLFGLDPCLQHLRRGTQFQPDHVEPNLKRKRKNGRQKYTIQNLRCKMDINETLLPKHRHTPLATASEANDSPKEKQTEEGEILCFPSRANKNPSVAWHQNQQGKKTPKAKEGEIKRV